MSTCFCRAAPNQFWFVFPACDLCPFHIYLVCGGSGDQDPQQVAAGITDQAESVMGTKPMRLGPDRLCLCWLCGGHEEQQPAFLWLPSCLLWEHDYMCHSLARLSPGNDEQN